MNSAGYGLLHWLGQELSVFRGILHAVKIDLRFQPTYATNDEQSAAGQIQAKRCVFAFVTA
jgi:hypothetical protein